MINELILIYINCIGRIEKKKCAKHSLELTELDVICKMLERENPYESFLNKNTYLD